MTFPLAWFNSTRLPSLSLPFFVVSSGLVPKCSFTLALPSLSCRFLWLGFTVLVYFHSAFPFLSVPQAWFHSTRLPSPSLPFHDISSGLVQQYSFTFTLPSLSCRFLWPGSTLPVYLHSPFTFLSVPLAWLHSTSLHSLSLPVPVGSSGFVPPYSFTFTLPSLFLSFPLAWFHSTRLPSLSRPFPVL